MNIVPLDDHVAQVDADAERDAEIFRQVGVANRDRRLNGKRVAHRVDGARKPNQDAVARGLDDAPAVGLDLGVDQLDMQATKVCARALVVGLDQAGVAYHVGHQDRRQPPLNAFFGHNSSARIAGILRAVNDRVHRA